MAKSSLSLLCVGTCSKSCRYSTSVSSKACCTFIFCICISRKTKFTNGINHSLPCIKYCYKCVILNVYCVLHDKINAHVSERQKSLQTQYSISYFPVGFTKNALMVHGESFASQFFRNRALKVFFSHLRVAFLCEK